MTFFNGTANADVIVAGIAISGFTGSIAETEDGFADTYSGFGGDDYILAGDTSDRLFGGDGNDDMNGGGGNDNLSGGAGGDTLIGEIGNDDSDIMSGGGAAMSWTVGTTPISGSAAAVAISSSGGSGPIC